MLHIRLTRNRNYVKLHHPLKRKKKGIKLPGCSNGINHSLSTNVISHGPDFVPHFQTAKCCSISGEAISAFLKTLELSNDPHHKFH